MSTCEFLKKKEQEGVKIERQSIPADQRLTPVQNQLKMGKIEEIADSFVQGSTNPCQKAILVSAEKDGKKYVIDGHHRYAACRLVGGGEQEVIVIHEDHQKVLVELDTFPGVRKSLEEI